MKKFNSENKYVAWGLTAFCVIAGAILFYMLLQHGGNVMDGINTLLGILSPIIWGLVIAYLLWPLTKMFERSVFTPLLRKALPKKDPSKPARAFSVFLSIIVALLCIAALLWLIIPQVYTSIESIVLNSQEYYETITTWIERFFEDYPQIEKTLLEATGSMSGNLMEWAKSTLLPSLGSLVTSVSAGVYMVLRAILNVLIGFVVACYVLFNMEEFGAKAKKVLYSIFSIHASGNILSALRFTDSAFMGFIRGKVIDSLIIGILCYIVCSLLRMPYVVLVSVIVGVTNIIPVFGPFIGAVPSALIILLVSPMKCLIFIIFIIVLQQIDGNIIGPKILGSSTGISGFWIMFAILLGGGLFGVVGMLLGVPVFVVVYEGIRRLVHMGLKKHGLQTETAQYVNIDAIDEETKLPIRHVDTETDAKPSDNSSKNGK